MSDKTKFSDIELASPGMRRQIAVYARPDDDPVLEILVTRDGAKAGRHLVHRRHIEPLAHAVRIARGGPTTGPDGSQSTGEITMRGGARVSFVVVLGRTPAVQLWLAAPDGRRLGRPTSIQGAELAALAAAIDYLQKLDVGFPGPRGIILASRGLAFGIARGDAFPRSDGAASSRGDRPSGASGKPAPSPTPVGATPEAHSRGAKPTVRGAAAPPDSNVASEKSRGTATLATAHGPITISGRELADCAELGLSPQAYATGKAALAASRAQQSRRSNVDIKR